MLKKFSSLPKLLIGIALASALSLAIVAIFYFTCSLRFDLKEVGKIPGRSWVYDMDGKVYSRLRGENRILLEADKISGLFKKALLAREDARFYEHHGIDPVGIARALLRDLGHFRIREGGSTITQQLFARRPGPEPKNPRGFHCSSNRILLFQGTDSGILH